ncbi:MAG: tripartite tricarboxylate transporter TctB family protein [Pseudomonadota bacterium]
MTRSSRAEIVVSLIIIAACIAVIIETLGLPPGSFEPLGSAPVPQVTAGLIIILCSLVIVTALRRDGSDGDVSDEQPASAFFLAVLTLAYAGAFHTKLVDFGVMTAAFLFVAIWGLERFRTRVVLPAAIVALIVGFGAKFIFTQVFVVDLPSWG